MNDNSKISPPSTNSYGSETNETTLSYETMRFSYHQCLTPATIMGPCAAAPEASPRLDGTLSSRHQPPTGCTRETLAFRVPSHRYGPATAKGQQHEKFEYFQIQKHHFQIRSVSWSSYGTIVPRPPLSYGSLNIVSSNPVLPRRLPYASFHILSPFVS